MKKSLRILAAAIAPVPFVAGAVLAGPANASAPSTVAMAQSVNPAIATSARVADMSAGEQLSFAVTLKPRNEAGLRAFLKQVSDPASPHYRHFLSPAQYTAAYAPSAADVAKVTAFLKANGLRVTKVSDNRQVVDVAGSAGQVEHALHTTIGVYRQQQRQFFANDSAPALPTDVAGVVSGVVGLDNHTVRHPMATRQAVSPRVSGFTPNQLHTAYDTGSLGTGAGVSVALWEFDGYQQRNITTYDRNFGLRSSATTTVSVDGANFDAAPGDGQGEVELDIEIVQAIAPAVRTFSYEAPNSDQGEIDLATQIATEDRVSVTSISWGACEAQRNPAEIQAVDAAFAQGVAEGISYYSASGDAGSDDCQDGTTGVDYPASDPNVTGVGGTTLRTNRTRSETAWDGSGGGESSVFPAPDYQGGVDTVRAVPDVSGDADPATGYAIFSAGFWQVFGGTSCAAPLWSGFTALHNALDGRRLGNPNPALYAVAAGGAGRTAFHDITVGSNGAFDAGPGYDAVTGIGSYDGARLHAALG